MTKKKLSILQALSAKYATKPKPATTDKDKPDDSISESHVDSITDLLDNSDSGNPAPAEFKTSFDLETLIKSVGATNFINNVSSEDMSEDVQKEINSGIRLALVSVAKSMHGSFQEDMQSYYNSKSGERNQSTQSLLDSNSLEQDDDPVFGTVGKLLQEQLRGKYPRATSSEINAAVREELNTHKESIINKANSENTSDNDSDDIPADDIDWAEALGVTFDEPNSDTGDEGAAT